MRGLVVAAILVMLGGLPSCKPSQTPRETARAVVLTLADGVSQADHACAGVARAKADEMLAAACAESYNDARTALLAAEDGIDAWSAAAVADLPCAAARVSMALRRISELVVNAGGTPMPAVVDALKFASPFAEACRA